VRKLRAQPCPCQPQDTGAAGLPEPTLYLPYLSAPGRARCRGNLRPIILAGCGRRFVRWHAGGRLTSKLRRLRMPLVFVVTTSVVPGTTTEVVTTNTGPRHVSCGDSKQRSATIATGDAGGPNHHS